MEKKKMDYLNNTWGLMREINDEFVMQFIPDTRFDEYQCCKHAKSANILQPVWPGIAKKFVAISVFYTGCLERDEGCRKDNIALGNLLIKYQWQLIPLEMNIPREYNFDITEIRDIKIW